MCGAIDFPLYMSHNLFTNKSGRLHTAGGLILQYLCWLFNKHMAGTIVLPSLHVPSLLSALLFGKALQTSTVSVREAPFMVLQELNSAVNQ